MFTPRLFKIKMHTRRVLILRRVLPIFAFLCASLMLAWPALTEQKEQFASVRPQTALKGAKVDMHQVRFFSADAKNQPMTVTAKSVQETDPEKQIVTLDNPKAVYKMTSGVTLTSVTAYGFAFQKEEYLYFEDEVTSTTDTGWTAYSSKVIVDYKNTTMESDSPVFITGPEGTLNAEGFFLKNKANDLLFKGKTRTVIFNEKEGEIVIESTDGLVIDRVQKIITAHSNATVTQKDKKLTGDKIVLYYTDQPEDRLKKVEAYGNVVASNSKEKITGDEGLYHPQTGWAIVTGDVHLYQGSTHLTGPKAQLNLKTGVSSLLAEGQSDPKSSTPGEKRRVRGTLTPNQMK